MFPLALPLQLGASSLLTAGLGPPFLALAAIGGVCAQPLASVCEHGH